MPLRRRYSLAEGDDVFVPYAPKTTADAKQMGWYKSQAGKDYTIFWWPTPNVFSVHDENLEPVNSTTYATKTDAVYYIQNVQDAGVKVPLPEREPTWSFSQSIDGSGGVDTWGGDRAKLAHSADWIRLKGIADYGGKFLVTYVWESGDASMVPADYRFSLKPGERRTVQNTQGGGVDYNVEVIWDGPLYTYKGQEQDEAAAGLEPVTAATEAPPAALLNGPIMQRIRAFIAARRGDA
jgi:hypothetical protein